MMKNTYKASILICKAREGCTTRCSPPAFVFYFSGTAESSPAIRLTSITSLADNLQTSSIGIASRDNSLGLVLPIDGNQTDVQAESVGVQHDITHSVWYGLLDARFDSYYISSENMVVWVVWYHRYHSILQWSLIKERYQGDALPFLLFPLIAILQDSVVITLDQANKISWGTG